MPHFGSAIPLTATLSLPITGSSPASTTAGGVDPERTYVFPASTLHEPTASSIGHASGVHHHRPALAGIGRIGEIMSARGHARSVSHGGNASMSCSVPNSAGSTSNQSGGGGGQTSAAASASSAATTNVGGTTVLSSGKVLRSAMKGHQRAFSHGQIAIKDTMAAASANGTASLIGKRPGHNRVGSKTDFILPPGHKDSSTAAVVIVPRGDLAGMALSAGGGCIGGETGGSDMGGAGGGGSGGGSASSGGRTGSGHSRQASRSESIYTLRRAEVPPWWRRLWWSCCRSRSGGARFQDERDRHRMVVPNHTVPAKTPKRDHPNGKRVGNKIRTTKYTLLSFVPNNLLEQFHRLANLYFIFIVVLNWYIDAFAKEVTMIPVAFVLGVTAVKDLFEDRRRQASDKRINNSTCRVYNG